MKTLIKPLIFLVFALTVVSCSKSESGIEPEAEQKRPRVDYEIIPGDDPFTFKFNNKSANYKELEWRFGDDSLSNEVSPEHVFRRAGVYQVNLKATAEDGSTARKLLEIEIKPESIGTFKAKSVGGGKVKFVYTTTADIESASWDFGDQTSSDEDSPEKTYDPSKLFTAKLFLTTAKGSVAEISRLVSSNGTLLDVTNKYLLNPGPKFATSARFGARWGIVADWRVNDAVKQREGGMGGWDEWDGNSMSMESWGGELDIINGKIQQTSQEPLPAGQYYYQLDFVGKQWKNLFYTVIAQGPEIPDVDKVLGNPVVLGYTGDLNPPNNFTTPFFNPATQPVTFGFVATFIDNDQYFRLRWIKLYKLDD